MNPASLPRLTLQIRLLALNGLLECARNSGCDGTSDGALREATSTAAVSAPFDIDTLQSLDFLFSGAADSV